VAVYLLNRCCYWPTVYLDMLGLIPIVEVFPDTVTVLAIVLAVVIFLALPVPGLELFFVDFI
jgi:hypothetical protein